MTLTVSLLRHAKSDWGDPGLDDFDRPLAPRGLEAAPRMGAAMLERGVRPDLVLCSAALRTRETLALVLAGWKGKTPETVYETGLYLAPPDTILDRLTKVPASVKHVLVVAHNPGLHGLALLLASKGDVPALERLADKFPTAALAVIDIDAKDWRSLRSGNGTLRHFLTPRGLAKTATT